MVTATSDKDVFFVEENIEDFRIRFTKILKYRGESIRYVADNMGLAPTTLMKFIKAESGMCRPQTLIAIEKYILKYEKDMEDNV